MVALVDDLGPRGEGPVRSCILINQNVSEIAGHARVKHMNSGEIALDEDERCPIERARCRAIKIGIEKGEMPPIRLIRYFPFISAQKVCQIIHFYIAYYFAYGVRSTGRVYGNHLLNSAYSGSKDSHP